jgi:hypothetical protein
MRDRRDYWIQALSKATTKLEVTTFWYQEMMFLSDLIVKYDDVLTDMHSFTDYRVNDVRNRVEELRRMWSEAHKNYYDVKDTEELV